MPSRPAPRLDAWLDVLPVSAGSQAAGLTRLFAAALRTPKPPPSPFRQFDRSPILRAHREAAAARLLSFFVRHAVLVRPLSEEVKIGLTMDSPQVEMALGVLLAGRSLSVVGQPYASFKQLRALLFLDTAAIEDSNEIRGLSPVTVRRFLFCCCCCCCC